MATVSYLTRKHSNYNSVICLISDGVGNQYRYSTGVKINNSKNLNKNRIREIAEEPNAKSFNKKLRELKSYIESQIELIENRDEVINKEVLKEIIKAFTGSPQAKKERNKFRIVEHLEEFILLIETGQKLKPNGERFGVRTIINYKTLKKRIKEYEDANGFIKPHLIDRVFYDKFVYFFTNDSKSKYKKSYIGRMINGLKALIDNYLIADLRIKFPNYRAKDFKKLESKSLKTYLTMKQLDTMFSLDLSSYDEEYSKVRDAYVFIAWTCGIRVGDYMQLNEEKNLVYIQNPNTDKKQLCLSFNQSKTKKKVIAPVPPKAEVILKRNNGLPRFSNEQKANEILKKVGKLCKFDKWCFSEETNEKKRQYELMVNHSARLSFCTNAYKSGMDTIQIMAISGHKTPQVLLGYIGVSEEEQALRMTDTNYFKMLDTDSESELRIA
jgi:integrase